MAIFCIFLYTHSSDAFSSPSGLLVNWQSSPSLGISAPISYSWIVPHITGAETCPAADQQQFAYRVQVSTGDFGDQDKIDIFWDSGQVESSESHNVPQTVDKPLVPGTRYHWRVKTWASSGCYSNWSTPATFYTAPESFEHVTPIWANGSSSQFVLFRYVVPIPKSPYTRGIAFVTARQSGPMEKLLGAYRLYVGGRAVAIGPGRGEVRTAAYADGGDKNHTQYDSIDISAAILSSGPSAALSLGLRCFHNTGGKDAMVGLEAHLEHLDGSKTVIRTNSAWRAFDATKAFGPGQSEGPNSVCYTAPQENIDARLMPHGWEKATYIETPEWQSAVAKTWPVVPTPKRSLPLSLQEGVRPKKILQEIDTGRVVADFGTNLMGGLRLEITGLAAGAKVQVTMSEEMADTESHTLLYPMRTGNHYRAVWTTGNFLSSVFESHEFKLFRYAEVLVLSDGSTDPPVYSTTNTCQEIAAASSSNRPSMLRIQCPQDGGAGGRRFIHGVTFASYGTPSGSCREKGKGPDPHTDCSGEEHGGGGCGDTFIVNSSCHAPRSQALAEQYCVGRTHCQLPVTDAFFGGDPCPSTHAQKRLAVDVTCGNSSWPLPYQMHTQGVLNQSMSQVHTQGVLNQSMSQISYVLTAWTVRYPFKEGEANFRSSNSMLDAVYNLSVNTLRMTSLDTATDSNTRERLPYEGDSFITGHSRLSLQREYQWSRHSWRHNILNPTSPTEWRQTTPLLAWLYYQHTGSLELLMPGAMEQQSQLPCVDPSSQLPNFTACERRTGGLGCPRESQLADLIDTPAVGSGRGYRDNYVMSSTSTVISSYLVGALRALSTLLNASSGGNHSHALALSRQADATQASLNRLAVDHSTGLYTDGVEGLAATHSSWHASVFATAFGLLPENRWNATLEFLGRKGMAGSVYAAYWLLRALYTMDSNHGYLALKMLTQCSINSWCHMLQQGATTVMEAWSREGKPPLPPSTSTASLCLPASPSIPSSSYPSLPSYPSSPSFSTFTSSRCLFPLLVTSAPSSTTTAPSSTTR